MSDDIYSKYNINIDKLQRDYIKNPLKRNDEIDIDDLKYLWINLNLSKRDLCIFFKRSEGYFTKIFQKYNIKKSQNKILEIRKKTNLNIFGTENPFQNEIIKYKIKNKNIKTYGVEYISQTKYFKDKYKKTCMEKYGVDNYAKTKECKIKEYNTALKNKTIGKSKEEDEIYKLLCLKYNLIKRNYVCELYPFRCDFYIPKIDTYIEYQGFWTHGKEPYIGTFEQKNIIKLWKSKNTPQYKKAISDWTIKDVLKRETAKKNHLKYLEFFNKKDFMDWYNGINNNM